MIAEMMLTFINTLKELMMGGGSLPKRCSLTFIIINILLQCDRKRRAYEMKESKWFFFFHKHLYYQHGHEVLTDYRIRKKIRLTFMNTERE